MTDENDPAQQPEQPGVPDPAQPVPTRPEQPAPPAPAPAPEQQPDQQPDQNQQPNDENVDGVQNPGEPRPYADVIAERAEEDARKAQAAAEETQNS